MPQFEQRLLGTDRGELWLARGSDSGPCLVRLLDYRLADADFRAAVSAMAGELASRRPPRVLQIVDHARLGDHYQIQYQVQQPVRSLAEHFGKQHWLERLHFVSDMLDIGQRWRESVAPPIGFHGGRVVACRLAGQWLPHLAPCPPTPLHSAYDFVHATAHVLAAIAPERLRNVLGTGAAEDTYSAGVLVLQALGNGLMPDLSPEQRLEAQARSVLIAPGLADAQIEREVRRIRHVADRLATLNQVTTRCIAFDAEARPRDTQELREACARVLDLKRADKIAAGLEAEGRTLEGLQLLEWARTCQGDHPAARRLSAAFCRRLERPQEELQHLERLLNLDPHDRDAIRRRLALRSNAYLARTPVSVEHDPEGDWLLHEMEQVQRELALTEPMADEDLILAKDLREHAARIHSLRGNLYGCAREWFELTKLDTTDVDAYCTCAVSYRDLAEERGISEAERHQRVDALNTFIDAGLHRLEQLRKAGLVTEEEATACAELLPSLRLP